MEVIGIIHNEGKNSPNKLKFSIWDTRTEENLNTIKEEFAEATERSNLESKTTDQRDDLRQP